MREEGKWVEQRKLVLGAKPTLAWEKHCLVRLLVFFVHYIIILLSSLFEVVTLHQLWVGFGLVIVISFHASPFSLKGDSTMFWLFVSYLVIGYSVIIYSFLKKASLHHILVPTAYLHTHLPCPLMPIPIFHTHWITYLSPSHHILSSFYTSITHFPHYFSYHPHHLSFIPHHFPTCMRPKTHGHPHLIIFLSNCHTHCHISHPSPCPGF